MVVVYAKARNNRDLNAASIQLTDANDMTIPDKPQERSCESNLEKAIPDKPYMVRPFDYDIVTGTWCGLMAMISESVTQEVGILDAVSSSPASKETTPGVTDHNQTRFPSSLSFTVPPSTTTTELINL
ncbi:hypothetical protein L2E82_35343 [Cichorium intybus]|uniref:Uncharacterized protein n=1 Tax=Cichorium intybus TaxID=13427 RepID=A0ACB9BNU2_CICIN|nr:hypothetical protein L2E82_35343 [Cichorium intybus]